MPRRAAHQAEQTRVGILRKGVELASLQGLGGVTIGRLSDATSMSKSGLFAYFGSREELELAIVETAAAIFEKEVLAGAGSVPGGLGRLMHVALAWLGYVENGPLRGGCFFAAVVPEIDDRPGRVRDRVAELTSSWTGALQTEAARAIDDGDLEVELEPGQIAFEIHAYVQEANRSFQLHGNRTAFTYASRALRRSLVAAATGKGALMIEEHFSRH